MLPDSILLSVYGIRCSWLLHDGPVVRLHNTLPICTPVMGRCPQIILQLMLMHMSSQTCGRTSLGYTLRTVLLEHWMCVYLIWLNSARLLTRMAVPIYTGVSTVWRFLCLHVPRGGITNKKWVTIGSSLWDYGLFVSHSQAGCLSSEHLRSSWELVLRTPIARVSWKKRWINVSTVSQSFSKYFLSAFCVQSSILMEKISCGLCLFLYVEING